MARTRIKADALPVPQNDDEAKTLLAEMIKLDEEVAQMAVQLSGEVMALQQAAEATMAPNNARITKLFQALQSYVESNRERLTGPKAKSFKWPGATLGLRTTPYAVKITKDRVPEICADLVARNMKFCLRIKTEPDRKLLLSVRDQVADIEGLSFTRREEFFVAADNGAEHVKATKRPAPTTMRGAA